MSRRARLFLGLAAAILLALAAWLVTRPSALSPPGTSSDAVARSVGGSGDARSGADAGSASDAPHAGGRDAGTALASRPLAPVRLSEARVRLDPSTAIGSLQGRVIAYGSGRPIAGALLSFEHAGRTLAVSSDDDGRFVLAPPELGTYVLAIATADGFLPFAPEWGQSPIRFEARAGAHVEGIVLSLVDAIDIVATVVRRDADREVPVEGADVWIHGAERGSLALAPLAARHRSDAAGEARFHAPDGAVIEAVHPEHGRGRAALDTSAQATRRLTVRLSRELAPGMRGDGRIAGRVVDQRGQPVEGARVLALYESLPGDGEAALHPPLEHTSDAQGRFVIEGADEGAYRLVASAAEHASATLPHVRTGRTDVEIALDLEARVRVRVIDDVTGRPIAAATVVVERATGPLTFETLALASAYDAEGTTEIGGLPAGACRVVALAPGYAPSAPVDVVASTDEAPAAIEVRMSRGGTLRGRVVSAVDRTPLEGARVTLEGRLGTGAGGAAESAQAGSVESTALSDAEGRFVLSGIPPETSSITVWAADHDGRVRSGITVPPGTELDLGDIDVRPVAPGERARLELAGIGAVLAADGDVMRVGQVFEGGGAAEVGLAPGDFVLAVDGLPVTSLGFEGTIEHIRGPEGTTVELLVRRTGRDPETLRVPRRRIRA